MKAKYHQATGAIELDVVKDHKNGTVDLGRGKDNVLIEKCPVSDSGKLGTCTLAKEEKLSAKEKAKQLEEAKARLAEVESALASDPENEELKSEIDFAKARVEELSK